MNEDRIKNIADKLAEKKVKQDAVKDKYDNKNKVKKLTTDERLARIEEYLGL